MCYILIYIITNFIISSPSIPIFKYVQCNNRAAALLRRRYIGDFESALGDCHLACFFTPNYVKAIHRAGQCFRALKKFGIFACIFLMFDTLPLCVMILFNYNNHCPLYVVYIELCRHRSSIAEPCSVMFS